MRLTVWLFFAPELSAVNAPDSMISAGTRLRSSLIYGKTSIASPERHRAIILHLGRWHRRARNLMRRAKACRTLGALRRHLKGRIHRSRPTSVLLEKPRPAAHPVTRLVTSRQAAIYAHVFNDDMARFDLTAS